MIKINEEQLMIKFKMFLKDNFSPGQLIWNHSYYMNKILTHNFDIDKYFWNTSIPIEKSMNKLVMFFRENGINLSDDYSTDYIWAFLNELVEKKYLDLIEQINSEKDVQFFMLKGKRRFSNDEYLFHGKQKLYKLTLKNFLENNGNTIFFAREFNNKVSFHIYKLIEEKIYKNIGLKTIMLENQPKSGNLNTRIYNEIKNAKYIIADITSKGNSINNNVIYEIGLAHGMKKKVLLIADEKMFVFNKKNSLPFDISPHTTINYSSVPNELEKPIDEIVNTILSDINASKLKK